MAVLEHLQKSRTVDEDEEADRNFLISFLPIFKKLPDSKNLWARVCISQIMQQAAEPGTTHSPNLQSPPMNFLHYANQYQVPPTINTGYHQPPQWNQRQTNNPASSAIGKSFHQFTSPSSSSALSPSDISDSSNIDVFSVIETDITQLN